jgi:ketosteroid isomerase-like protein
MAGVRGALQMTGTDTETVVRAVYDAWRLKDLDRVAALCADNFCHDIHIAPSVHPLGGPAQGKAAIDRLKRITEQFDFVSYEIAGLIVSGGRAAAQAHLRYIHKPTGESLETTLGHFWTVRNGLVERLDEYHDMGTVQAFASKVVAPL